MAATRQEIASWLDELYAGDATHLIVVCDTFGWDDYPVFVSPNEDVHERIAHYSNASMQRIMEIYSRSHDKNAQLNEKRARHTD